MATQAHETSKAAYPFAVSGIVSTFRANYTVETLTRIHRVTGQSFAVSGDAPLRHSFKMLKQRMNTEFAKVADK